MELSKVKINFVYASEANPVLDGNIRDHGAIEQLVVLSNIESINAMLVAQGNTK